MCRGYDQWAIAQMLSISPATIHKHRQSIYKQLDVHNTQEAIIRAFQTGLYFPLETEGKYRKSVLSQKNGCPNKSYPRLYNMSIQFAF